MVPQERRLYSAEEVADQLGCSKRTVWNLMLRGELESVRLGHLRKVPAEAVDEYIDSLRRHAGG
jgi:excisionase family DNA binding protein